jgi:PAS domain S-box-containing protein
MSAAQSKAIAGEVFVGGGEMGELMRSYDWSQTSLGAVQNWSQSLKTAVRIMLTSRQAMFVWWGEDLINLYNDAYRAILGGKHPEALGQPASQVWREIWDQVGPRAASAIVNNEGTYDEALLLIMERNGYPEETYYTFSYSPVPDVEGRTGGIICANTDDTQRIIGERQLALLKELASRTADARTFADACTLSASCLATNPHDLPFGMIYLVEPDQQCAVLAGTCGIEPGHPLAPPTIALNHPNWHFEAVLHTQQPALISELAAQFNPLPTGAWQKPPQQLVVVPIAPSGKTGKAGILVAGLNPFRLFDDNYQRFLNLVSAQIAASIANAQAYEEERKRAEALAELDRAKTTFFSNVSHEFRTPLTLMLSPLEELLAADDKIPAEQRQQLELIHRNSLRLLKLVNTLLDFSRIEAGRVQAVYEPTDLSALTAELASVFRSAIEQAGLQFIVACDPLSELVYVDRQMWEKIIFNLLSNAFKFTFEGAIVVTLRQNQTQQNQTQVELTVRDTGIGIPAAEVPRLFERFYRVEGAQGRTQEGSGIGLALVQELVRLHGGHVQVATTEGKGTTFTLTIPMGSHHLPSEHIQAAQPLTSTALGAAPYVEEALRWLPEADEQTRLWGDDVNLPASLPYYPTADGTARILLVDDNTDMRDYVKRLLLNQGYDVETAADGMAALAIIQHHSPDLVLTDVMMPRLDGFGLLRELRSTSTTKDIPIILLSARAGEEARVEGLEAGADDYLIKPFSARELLARVEASLKLARLRQETAQRERTILERVTDAFMALDLNFRFTYANKAAQQVSQTPLEDLLGKTMWEAFPATVGTQFEFQYRRSLSEQIAVEFEEYYAPLDLWVEVHVYPSPSGLSLFFRDINDRKQLETERKQAEAALRESEARFRQMADSAPMLVWMAGADTLCTYFNQPWLNFTGRTLEQELGNGWTEGIHPDDVQRCLDIYTTAFDAHRPFEMDYRLRRFDGEYRWIFDAGIPRFTPEGQFLGYIGSCLDISDRKRAEEALRRANERFEYAAAAVDCLIYDWDIEQDRVERSEGLTRILGYTCEDTKPTGAWWRERLHPEDLQRVQADSAHVLATCDRYTTEYRVLNKDNQYVYVADQGIVVSRDATGNPTRVIGSTVDIHDRKQAEAEREHLLARERTAREDAETANRIKDEFLAVLSHELRSPLNPILGWSRLLQTRPFDQAGAQHALQTIERNAKLQTQLIEDLLDVSRILQGKMVLNVYSVNLATVIESSLETVRVATEAKRIQIRTVVTFNPAQTLGDAARLQQIVWNLLSNAVKFTPEGGQVEVHLDRVGPYAQIQVKDTGKGISPDFLPYVFEYFRQEDGKTTRKFGGLGLGLAIVRHLTELHGGTVQAESPGEGQGATFTVRLPLRVKAAESDEARLTPKESMNFDRLRILVVDDEEDMRDLVKVILEQQGAQVTVVASAAEALIGFDRQPPDLLISDIGMPEIDGYMLMQQIRSRSPDQGGRVPAIALTAYAGEYDQQQAIAVGFQMHLSKPIDPDHLIAMIANLVVCR